ncbi:MAG: toxin TcdB middle/N-terminal domain-containing protein [Spirochaetota bacterium]
MLLDINGDGMPDKVHDDGRIYFYNGYGYGNEVKKADNGLDKTNGISINLSATAGGKIPVFIPVPFALIFIGTIQISGGGGATMDASSTSYGMRDMNGDGLPDIVYDYDGKLYVRYNRTGKTNMLKSIKNSIGGTISLDYKRVGNTRYMPQSQWVLSKVTVNDGTALLDTTSGSIHSYTTRYEYENGIQDRKNREFLGFTKVVEKKADGSTVEKEYYTDDYYKKGLLKKQIIQDNNGAVYVIKEYNYGIKNLLSAQSLWLYEIKQPYLVYEKTTYKEGGGGNGVTHIQRYAYDEYGNVTMYKDEGSPDTQEDDVIASISYYYNTAAYIVNKPLQIAVMDANGKVYRNRAGTYDSKGNLTRLRIMGGQNGYALWEFAYDGYGNLVVVKEPANHTGQSYYVQYTYDTTGTYIEKTTDAYGYTATARYNPAFGTPYYTRDINGYSFQYHHDVFGRLTHVWGPYDMAGGRPAVEVKYEGAIVTGEGIQKPAKAITYNRSGGGYNEVIAVVKMADGIGRELQVKTQAQVRGEYGFTVSGAKVYDELGRVVAEGKPIFEAGENFEYTAVALEHPTGYQYDCMGRKVRTTYPDGGVVVAGYGVQGGKLIECITDQNGNSKLVARDVRGNIVKVTEEGGITTTYTYDVLNQLVRVIDAHGNTTSITYDTWGRRTAIDNPDTGKTEFVYDDAGNLIAKQTANLRQKGQWIRYVYHFKQLKKVDNPISDDVYIEYGRPGDGRNGAGRVVQEKAGSLCDSYWYGALGEVIKKERIIEATKYSIQWVWDNFGRVRSIKYSNNFSVYYAYDAGGR